MEAGDERAKLSFEVECYRLRKYIGAYMAAIGEVDAIVFSAGVGENSFLHRQQVCQGLESLGIRLDDKKNKQAVGGQIETEISSPLSRIRDL